MSTQSTCPLAGERWHMRRSLPQGRRRQRYIRQGGRAPARAVPIVYPQITGLASGRRHWVLTPSTPPIYDLVLVGCGKLKRPQAARARDLYVGPVFSAHRAIVDRIGLRFHVLSAKHGPVRDLEEIEPYQTGIDEVDPKLWNEHIYRFITARARQVEGREFRVLVLAGVKYLAGWLDRVRALGVRVDDPLKGYEVGDRRTFANRFVAARPAADRREQLLGFGAELERVLAAEVAAATATSRPQLNLWDEPPTSPVEPPGRRARARGPRADGARVGGNLGLHARRGA